MKAALLGSAALLAMAISAADAQPARRNTLPPTGAACHVRGAGELGKIRRDACNRPYCASASYRDPIDVVPNIAQRAKCRWTVVQDACRCVKPASPSKRRS